MTTDDEILKELREHTRLIRAEIGLLSEIKFELQNARKMSEMTTYKIPIKKPSFWEVIQYWFRVKTRI